MPISIAVFAGLVAAAVVLRRQPEWHKRVMVLASIRIVAPALARISRWPIFGGEDSPFIRVVLLALLLAVIAHDLVRERRVHKATIYGVGTIVAATSVLQLIARSELGLSVVRALE
jgi:isoprenylcysteine carboxyl methyltransferase (ICMT) family protein YpbQ